jgi:predicted peroxiredoxin
MAKYLLIESRDPYEWNDVAYYYDLAYGLAREGHDVTLYLVQNGVLPARKSPRSGRLVDLTQAGVKVMADDFSLSERGIPHEALAVGVKMASIDQVAELLADSATRAVWH